MRLILITAMVISLAACETEPTEYKSTSSNPTQQGKEKRKENKDQKSDKVIFKPMSGARITGDFDGDGTIDTIQQSVYSRHDKAEITTYPDPFQNEWDTVMNYFYDKEADVRLRCSATEDVLRLGVGMGLYCLLNIGDNNGDGRDEVALVIDYVDYSNVNDCYIYSLCNYRWTKLKNFSIHESAFQYDEGEQPDFKEIKDFLEKENGKWKFIDYHNDISESPEDVGKMKELVLPRCK